MSSRRFYLARHDHLSDMGRPMVLRRRLTTSAVQDVTVQGFLSMYGPDQVGQGDIMQGDGRVAISNDEIADSGWPGPPHARDQMMIDSRIWTVRGATPVYEGAVLIGHNLFVRGG